MNVPFLQYCLVTCQPMHLRTELAWGGRELAVLACATWKSGVTDCLVLAHPVSLGVRVVKWLCCCCWYCLRGDVSVCLLVLADSWTPGCAVCQWSNISSSFTSVLVGWKRESKFAFTVYLIWCVCTVMPLEGLRHSQLLPDTAISFDHCIKVGDKWFHIFFIVTHCCMLLCSWLLVVFNVRNEWYSEA